MQIVDLFVASGMNSSEKAADGAPVPQIAVTSETMPSKRGNSLVVYPTEKPMVTFEVPSCVPMSATVWNAPRIAQIWPGVKRTR